MFGYISLAQGFPTENNQIAEIIQAKIHSTIKKNENVGIRKITGLLERNCAVVLNTEIQILIEFKQKQQIKHDKPASAHRI